MSEEQPSTDPRVDRPRVVPAGSVRRGPRMVPFLATGAIIGAIIGIVLSASGPSSQVASPGQEMIVMAGSGALLCGMVAAVVYLIVDWASMRRQ